MWISREIWPNRLQWSSFLLTFSHLKLKIRNLSADTGFLFLFKALRKEVLQNIIKLFSLALQAKFLSEEITKSMRNRFPSFFILLSFFSVLLFSCGKEEQNYVPRPKGFNRIDLPPQRYQKLAEDRPYSFEYSKSATILPDTFALAGKDWIFIYYPQFKANIQLTYKQVNNNQNLLRNYINDSFKLTGKHQVRASSIQEQRLVTAHNLTAMIFKIEGDVPSPYQFYTTDSTKNFLRGAIYFSTAAKNDSLAPVINFIQKDMIHLLNTLQWR